MERIIIHWTAGGYQPNKIDYEHYHYMITGNGRIVNGNYTPEDNINCYDGKYAAHTGGGNTRAIGVAMCGMAGFKNSNQVGNYPLKPIQVEACFQLVAKLCKQYKIQIDSNHVMTHYEFGLKNPTTSSKGKIDIVYLPPYPKETAAKLGDFIRNKIEWYYNKL